MKKLLICALVLLMLGLACSITPAVIPTEPVTAVRPTGTPTAGATAENVSINAQVANTPHAPQRACTVFTRIDGGALNLRSCASATCPIIDVLREGETVTVLQAGQDWYLVQTGNAVTGWVNSDFCK